MKANPKIQNSLLNGFMKEVPENVFLTNISKTIVFACAFGYRIQVRRDETVERAQTRYLSGYQPCQAAGNPDCSRRQYEAIIDDFGPIDRIGLSGNARLVVLVVIEQEK